MVLEYGTGRGVMPDGCVTVARLVYSEQNPSPKATHIKAQGGASLASGTLGKAATNSVAESDQQNCASLSATDLQLSST